MTVKDLYMSSVRTKFFSLFWDNEHCRQIFLQHKEQLLEKKEFKFSDTVKPHHYYLQRIVVSNSLKRIDSLNRLEGRLMNRHIDISHNLETRKNQNFNEEKILGYLKNKFEKPIEKISKRLNGSNVSQIRLITEFTTALISEARLIKFLKKYDIISENTNSLTDIQTSVESFLNTELAKILTSDKLGEILKSLDEIASFYEKENFESLMDADKFFIDVLYDKESFKDRIEIFDMLYDAGCLIGGVFKTFYECTHCEEGVFSGNVKLNVRPQKVKLKCPNCNKEVFYLAPYKIDDTLFNEIKSKDGILHSAVEYFLKEEGFTVQSNVVVPKDIEIDLQLVNSVGKVSDIIETKMFKTDRPEDTIKSNLKEGLSKLIRAKDKLIAGNVSYQLVKFHYLTNIDDEEMINDVRREFGDSITKQKIRIHSVESFRKYFDDHQYL